MDQIDQIDQFVMLYTMFPDTAFSDMYNEKILSIGVLECEVIRVGDVIWGTKEAE